MDPKEIWQTVLGEIELQISRPNFLTWLKQSELLSRDEKEGTAFVGLPNNFAKEWVKNRYHKIILGSLRNIDGSIKNISYVVVNNQNPSAAVLKKTRLAKSMTPQAALIEVKIDPKTNLNPKYTLESFVVGSSNELAYAAIQAITKEVGRKYNPLFVYGGVGLGKTHLLQAGGNEIQKNHENKNVLYVTSEKFINDVVWSIRNKRMEDMKKKYRDVDVLIIDDIQFIGGKPSTEQEFFYTFNVLYENSKQIIISSDRAPAAIPTLEERLRSRFEGGMIVDIGYPDYEMRLAILKTKVLEHGWSVMEKTLESVAAKVQRNIRELEGVLNKVVFYEQYKNEKIDAKKLDEIISETTQLAARNITAGNVLSVVAEFFEVSPNDLAGRSRKSEVVEPRQICMYLLRDILKLSYPHIGEKLGHRDHTTAIHACEKITRDVNQNPTLNQKIMLIKERLYKNGG
ncbi:MAG: chromosomal replication initiation protein [Candidatus Jorgensenbacteria bacterium GW2011_GWA1_48_13]|uniref:Chromosomal replication initiator protein DnaA n=2 Tax=Candidatus Joergenseniibacteriota TaxID=1752739 RepID=A0A0G1W947_9BACT|nr:MAG: chromosomal replication initiation protein [Candidatus Jorgensenbacteria bacterium GW2011_GWA1_48_13]KKU99062.1 MAG: chromosomal replication initiation protein [Candidatus Jorgensenbacteria bacterium GW2011_GWC1_48_8]KKW15298.1 MAG: chromosomal replication initiation protein [Candidatus Jorgensenbacteria bacterium GW2011_GWB1_50_10]